MIQKKICMLGAFAVGKTSLVSRYVRRIFSDKYLTTVGVKVDKKTVQVGAQDVDLLIWDIHGEDRFQKVRPFYLKGSAGYLLVVDATRRNTLNAALSLQTMAEEAAGKVPGVLVLNKSDLADEWDIETADIEGLERSGWTVVKASAKLGTGVEEAFQILTQRLLEPPHG